MVSCLTAIFCSLLFFGKKTPLFPAVPVVGSLHCSGRSGRICHTGALFSASGGHVSLFRRPSWIEFYFTM
jgi:hypothetical protein